VVRRAGRYLGPPARPARHRPARRRLVRRRLVRRRLVRRRLVRRWLFRLGVFRRQVVRHRTGGRRAGPNPTGPNPTGPNPAGRGPAGRRRRDRRRARGRRDDGGPRLAGHRPGERRDRRPWPYDRRCRPGAAPRPHAGHDPGQRAEPHPRPASALHARIPLRRHRDQGDYPADQVPKRRPVWPVPHVLAGTATWFSAPGRQAAYPALDPSGGGCQTPANGCATLPYLSLGSELVIHNECSGRSATMPVTQCGCTAARFCDRCVTCGTSPRGRIVELSPASFVDLGGDLDEGCFNVTVRVG
jgi:hypothetical protein